SRTALTLRIRPVPPGRMRYSPRGGTPRLRCRDPYPWHHWFSSESHSGGRMSPTERYQRIGHIMDEAYRTYDGLVALPQAPRGRHAAEGQGRRRARPLSSGAVVTTRPTGFGGGVGVREEA